MSEQIAHKLLGTSFKHRGFDYQQLDRVGDVAMFEQTKTGLSCVWYEVVIVQRHNGYEISEKKIEPAEMMPPASAWGKHGWTFRDKPKALAKFVELVSAARIKAETEVRLSA